MISRLSWDAVPNAVFRIKTQVWDDAGLQWGFVKTELDAASPYEVTVQPNTKYRHILVSLDAAQKESPPAIVEFTTPPLTGAPTTPANVVQETIQ